MEKALDLWVEDMDRKRMPIDGNMLRQKDSLKRRTPSHLQQVRDGCIDSGIGII
jgi:hypothetical protein